MSRATRCVSARSPPVSSSSSGSSWLLALPTAPRVGPGAPPRRRPPGRRPRRPADPRRHWTTANFVEVITQHIYEGLYTLDQSYQPIPDLAEGMPR